ncbi:MULTISPECIES: Atu2307/SP_0267 family LLM class monooxygenase [unclassified Aureimonas]|uniref:Atu2307/SP_0267 family LLM class monooxygenase n=1 Tax=unclassified Aureimonas TaxID=2615206 RepID=UPI0006FD0B87|nr:MULTISPECIES: Atu2307/SP_0267 family LLM class monooxygenase [unclassified Aureimonas]KQT52287.1 luciferase [Aureimonas sp. Leaf427]KQT61827.1 luciferase [Aureimonas sp. Leaf460]
MEIGIDSFAVSLPDPSTGATIPQTERMERLLDEVETADRAGLDVFGIGEHHRAEFLDSAPALILAAAAARTQHIRLTSAVTVLSAADPVRVFQDFATLDLIAKGRAEIVVGRGSFGEAYPLFGFSMHDYDALFAEKLDLLLKLRDKTHVTWHGRFRPPIENRGVFPRPSQAKLPIWLGVGGTPESFARAGTLGLPLMVAIIGGSFQRFRPLIDLYRAAGSSAGHAPKTLKVGVHAIGFVGETAEAARDAFFPGHAYMISTIGRERGWSPPSRSQFDAMCGPDGAFLIGDPRSVAEKAVMASRALGGISRLTFQMSPAMNDPMAMRRSIELLGSEVAPVLRTTSAAPQTVDALPH